MPNTSEQTTILALESSGDAGGACILRGAKILAEVQTPGQRGHGAHLVPCVDEAFRSAGVEPHEIQLIVINEGPGSYTGLRISLACAEAMGYALGVPVLGVPCFEVMMEELSRQGRVTNLPFARPMLDARQDQVMTARFAVENDSWRRLSEDELVTPEELDSKDALHFGEGARVYGTRFSAGGVIDVKALDLRPSSLGLASYRLYGLSHGLNEADPNVRVGLRYFRPVLAKTVAERQAEADARATLRQAARDQARELRRANHQ